LVELLMFIFHAKLRNNFKIDLFAALFLQA
jgi:hypothetical protein